MNDFAIFSKEEVERVLSFPSFDKENKWKVKKNFKGNPPKLTFTESEALFQGFRAVDSTNHSSSDTLYVGLSGILFT